MLLAVRQSVVDIVNLFDKIQLDHVQNLQATRGLGHLPMIACYDVSDSRVVVYISMDEVLVSLTAGAEVVLVAAQCAYLNTTLMCVLLLCVSCYELS